MCESTVMIKQYKKTLKCEYVASRHMHHNVFDIRSYCDLCAWLNVVRQTSPDRSDCTTLSAANSCRQQDLSIEIPCLCVLVGVCVKLEVCVCVGGYSMPVTE